MYAKGRLTPWDGYDTPGWFRPAVPVPSPNSYPVGFLLGSTEALATVVTRFRAVPFRAWAKGLDSANAFPVPVMLGI